MVQKRTGLNACALRVSCRGHHVPLRAQRADLAPTWLSSTLWVLSVLSVLSACIVIDPIFPVLPRKLRVQVELGYWWACSSPSAAFALVETNGLL